MKDQTDAQPGGQMEAAVTGAVEGFNAGIDTTAIPQILAGLQPGRIVNYVMKSGFIRPLIIVAVLVADGFVAGALLFNGRDDSGIFPDALGSPVVTDTYGRSLCSMLVTANFEDLAADRVLTPGTWHWPTKQPVMADSVDPGALDAQLLALIDEKLQGNIDHVQALLDSHAELITSLKAEIASLKVTDTTSPSPAPPSSGEVAAAAGAGATEAKPAV